MTDKRVKVPEGMIDAVHEATMLQGRLTDKRLLRQDLEVALRWLTEHPIVPTDEQVRLIRREHDGTLRGAVETFQRLVMFTEPEPECSEVCDLLWKSNPFPNTGSQHRHDSAVREAFKRGQQSMIRKATAQPGANSQEVKS